MKIKSFYILLFWIFVFTGSLKSLTILNVTNNTLGNPGSIDVVLSQAETLANSGQSVIVYLNAPSLIPVNWLGLNLTAGSITIQKDPAATTVQGFTGGIDCFTIISPNQLGNINFKEVTFDGYYQNSITLFAINNANIDNVKIINFDYRGISLDDGVSGLNATPGNANPINGMCQNVTISNCLFSDIHLGAYGLRTAIQRNNSINSTNLKQLKILNNDFQNNEIIRLATNATSDNLKIEIKNNYSSVRQGFQLEVGRYMTTFSFPITFSGDLVDYKFNLQVKNNQARSISLCRPLNYWEINNNTFIKDATWSVAGNVGGMYRNYPIDLITAGIYNYAIPSTSIRQFKSGLINSPISCTNQNFLNNSNSFQLIPLGNRTQGVCVESIGNTSTGCSLTEITGQNFPMTAFIAYNTVFRRNRVITGNYGVPIINYYNPINASISLATIASNNVNITYNYTGITNSDNNDLYVDVYKSNSFNDLLEYIGEQIIPVGSLTGSGNLSIPIPSSVTLNGTDKIAITLTGIHPASNSNVVAIGTSNAFFKVITCGGSSSIISNSNGCLGYPLLFNVGGCQYSNAILSWDFGDGNTAIGSSVSHAFSNLGSYNVVLTIINPSPYAPTVLTTNINITDCPAVNACKDCIGSFSPEAGEYILSLWVKEDQPNSVTTYLNAGAKISFVGSSSTYGPFYPNLLKNKIIDGWQRIEERFTVPAGATSIKIELINNYTVQDIDCYYDDVRIFPINGNMKSYVYDPINLRLAAELDENNYATFYEYDEEGKLIRVKKETERGIMTIKEARNNTKKK